MPEIRNPKNAGWFFHRGFYENSLSGILTSERVKKRDFSREAKIMTEEIRFSRVPSAEPFSVNSEFDLTVCYPGLLIGSGYQHETGALEEFKIGFFFDYSTGLPQIPGSSVKGTLRSFFPERDKGDLRDAKYRYLVAMIEEVTKENPLSHPPGLEEVLAFEQEIFQGRDFSQKGERYHTIYCRDRFFDAVLSPSNRAGINYLGSDFVTPHHPNLLEDPIPIKFLKILPEIIIRFRFELTDSFAIEGISKKHKEELFKRILLATGIGAKTNVGYGQFTPDQPNQQPVTDKRHAKQTAAVQDPPVRKQVQPKDYIDEKANDQLKSGKVFDGKIAAIEKDNKKFRVTFKVEGVPKDCVVTRKNYKIGKGKSTDLSRLKIDLPVKVRINSDYTLGETLNCTILLNK
ncbi:CRISPR type III-B/RAMP module RAMP protein Cmr6 [Cyclobacterium xiamenense]|uniref:CRISPR type III-B/RAMP module RAMP protein Cmr6 n=1 Tax=Cyclobacterium xiamenense TaxID=1297121 RepID=A0A1H7BZV9_9BACT|nr:type III-B CRISPR module RAMP protein Cmr6 [Cyclobacterium xiamenense]SEJ81877.1 CRISPR type III-B/RAMP module RAMP protein Cmr6 [Cyclobacterium xiamenense]